MILISYQTKVHTPNSFYVFKILLRLKRFENFVFGFMKLAANLVVSSTPNLKKQINQRMNEILLN